MFKYRLQRVWSFLTLIRLPNFFCLVTVIGSVSAGAPTYAAGNSYSVSHALGTTTLFTAPKRIVTLGWSGEDVVLALGQKPIAMTRYGSFPSGMFPWTEEKLFGHQPILMSGDFDYEKIAALNPDLIIGVYSGIDERSYKRLSSIAPTVVYRSAPWSADWREQTTVIGEALGKSSEAESLIVRTDVLLEEFSHHYTILKGKTFTFGTYIAGGNGIVVYLPKDPRVAALMGVGLIPSKGIEHIASANPEETSISIAFEDIASIDADILIMWYGEGAREAAEAQPLFQILGAVKSGAYVALDDPISVWSTSALSILSIPYGFPRFLPKLAEAATKTEAR